MSVKMEDGGHFELGRLTWGIRSFVGGCRGPVGLNSSSNKHGVDIFQVT